MDNPVGSDSTFKPLRPSADNRFRRIHQTHRASEMYEFEFADGDKRCILADNYLIPLFTGDDLYRPPPKAMLVSKSDEKRLVGIHRALEKVAFHASLKLRDINQPTKRPSEEGNDKETAKKESKPAKRKRPNPKPAEGGSVPGKSPRTGKKK